VVGCVGVSAFGSMWVCVFRWARVVVVVVPKLCGLGVVLALFLALHWAWMRRLLALGRVGWVVGVFTWMGWVSVWCGLCVEEGGGRSQLVTVRGKTDLVIVIELFVVVFVELFIEVLSLLSSSSLSSSLSSCRYC
jgi:hypothetical protein